MIGQTVGNYRITRLLGEGGMGVVYLAEHPGIGRKAAVKVLHAELTQNAEMANRFFNEARAANAIRHAGIVEVFDFGTLPSGVSYIVMELLEGESLARRLQSPAGVPMAAAIDYAAQAAAALGAAHQKGIIHRDLKPDNLFIVPDPRNPAREMIKVLDFGIAKLTARSADAGSSGSFKTRTGTVLGTPIYMSPEQCRGTRELDSRTDIYSLGVILYEMLCGAPPFQSEGHGELIHLHISAAPPPPRTRNPAIPPVLESVVLTALAKDPAERFQTMQELAQALAGATAAAGAAPVARAARAPSRGSTLVLGPQTTLSASPGAVDASPAAPTSRRWRGWVLGALAMVAVAGGLVTMRLRPQGGEPRATVTEMPSAPAAPTRAPAAPAPAALTPSAPAPVEPPPPGPPASATPLVAVHLTSEPTGVRIVRNRDGAVIGVTPFNESWPAAAGVEKLRLELDGYRGESVIVPLDRGVELAFHLKPLSAPPAHKKPSKNSQAAPEVPPAAPTPVVAPVAPPAPQRPAAKTEPVPL